MVIDTSVIVAILSKESDATEFANKIEAAQCCTGMIVWIAAQSMTAGMAVRIPIPVLAAMFRALTAAVNPVIVSLAQSSSKKRDRMIWGVCTALIIGLTEAVQ